MSYFFCSVCGDERSDSAIGYREGFDHEVCVDCATPEYVERRKRTLQRDREIGHTGDSMCGCERCALRFELSG